MEFSEKSVIRNFLQEAGIDENSWFISQEISLSKPGIPRIVYLGDDLNEPEDTGFYSDRFPSWCSQELKEEIEREMGCSVYCNDIWCNKEKTEKVIGRYCLVNNMVSRGDKIVVTSIIHLINKSDGADYSYITYRIEK